MTNFLIFLVALPSYLVALAWSVTKLWAWFAVPIFTLPELSLHEAAGLVILCSILTKRPTVNSREEPTDEYIARCVLIILNPLLLTLIAWPISAFV